MEDFYSIGELVKELNINKETIRYYEKIGLLSEPKKDINGYRLYTQQDVDTIKFILIVKEFGFSLKEIGALLSMLYNDIYGKDIEGVKRAVESKIDEINRKMEEFYKTKNLLQKVYDDVLCQNKICYSNIENFVKRNS